MRGVMIEMKEDFPAIDPFPHPRFRFRFENVSLAPQNSSTHGEIAFGLVRKRQVEVCILHAVIP